MHYPAVGELRHPNSTGASSVGSDVRLRPKCWFPTRVRPPNGRQPCALACDGALALQPSPPASRKPSRCASYAGRRPLRFDAPRPMTPAASCSQARTRLRDSRPVTALQPHRRSRGFARPSCPTHARSPAFLTPGTRTTRRFHNPVWTGAIPPMLPLAQPPPLCL